MHVFARWVGAPIVASAILALAPAARAADTPITPEARMHFAAGVALLQDPKAPRYEEAYREFKAAYEAAFAAGALRFSGALAHLAEPARFAACLGTLGGAEWVVYSKRPFAGPEQVLAYLGRYTHRVAISNNRRDNTAQGSPRWQQRRP